MICGVETSCVIYTSLSVIARLMTDYQQVYTTLHPCVSTGIHLNHRNRKFQRYVNVVLSLK